MHGFKEWTLAALDNTFSLTVEEDSPVLTNWLNGQAAISAFEQEALQSFRSLLAPTRPTDLQDILSILKTLKTIISSFIRDGKQGATGQ